MTGPPLLLVDNNCFRRLESPGARARLRASLRATGKEFWPSGLNVLEAVKSRDPDMRMRLLTFLSELAGGNHALTLPTEALRRIAEAMAEKSPTIDWSEPRLTRFFRDPASVTDKEADGARQHLLKQERDFNDAHDRARVELRPALVAEDGRSRWTSVGQFLDEVWSTPDNLGTYVERLWENWGLPHPAPIEQILSHQAWRLYFDGWGATVYARLLAHPQLPLVESSDLQQLVYLGPARNRLLVSDDIGFQRLATAILTGRYHLARVVPLDVVLS